MPSVSSVFENGNPRVTIKPGCDSATVTAGANRDQFIQPSPAGRKGFDFSAGDEFGRTRFSWCPPAAFRHRCRLWSRLLRLGADNASHKKSHCPSLFPNLPRKLLLEL
jgi:hypothetical protein